MPIGPIRHGDDLALARRGQQHTPSRGLPRRIQSMIESVRDVLFVHVSGAMRGDRRNFVRPDWRMINFIPKEYGSRHCRQAAR
jgi:hypothetical protein